MSNLIVLLLSTVVVVYIVRLQERIRDLEFQLSQLQVTSEANVSPSVLGEVSPGSKSLAEPGSTSGSLARSSSIRGDLERIFGQDRLLGSAQLMVRLNEMTKEEASEAFAFLKEQTNAGSRLVTSATWQVLWMRWGLIDPEGALAHAQGEIPSYSERDRVTKHIFEGLGQSDPEAAAALILSKPNLHDRHRAVEGLSVKWARKDPAAVTQWALANLEGIELANAMHGIPWGVNSRGGYEKALEWWERLPNEEAKRHAFGSMSEIYRADRYGASIEDRAKLVESGLASGITDRGFLSFLGGEYGLGDRERGLELLCRVPPEEGSGYYYGLDLLVLQWTRMDPTQAGEWLRENLDQPWSDTAILGYAQSIAGVGNKEAARQWMDQIQNETLRARWTP